VVRRLGQADVRCEQGSIRGETHGQINVMGDVVMGDVVDEVDLRINSAMRVNEGIPTGKKSPCHSF